MVESKDICYNCINEFHDRCWNLKFPTDAWCKCPDKNAHSRSLIEELSLIGRRRGLNE